MRRPAPVRVLSTLLASTAIALAFPCVALAGWSSEPVTVTPTTASIPLVEACSDGAHGSFVIWQEETTPGVGVLRAQHLLPSGDLDPEWPAEGAVACSALVAREMAGALPDRLGGFYLWWKEGATLYLTRLDAAGHVATGWPARGRQLGSILADSPEPCFIEDCAHGVYGALVSLFTGVVTAYHLGPDNAGAGGWPNSARGVGPAGDGIAVAYYPQLALAPDGGVFVAWGFWSQDTTFYPSEFKLRRLTSAGLNAAGWPPEGLGFGAFRRELLGTTAKSAVLALSPDGSGGVFLVTGTPVSASVGYWEPATISEQLRRLQGDGQAAPGWPAEGRDLGQDGYVDEGPDLSYRVLPDGQGGALVAIPWYGELGPVLYFRQYAPPDWIGSGGGGIDVGVRGGEYFAKGDGGMFSANYWPVGPYQRYDPDAYIWLGQSLPSPGWTNFYEYHSDILLEWYGDIGLASTDDGGAVFFWSQMHERIGLFARRFGPGGEVTAVEPVPARFALRGLRFVRGAGVRASVSLPDDGPARFALFDVSGRRVAEQDVGGTPGTREVTFAGTQALAPGLYFGRLASPHGTATGRVIVLH